jgi:PhnB protein
MHGGAGTSMRVEPYLYFNGSCEEALAFYRAAIGAKTMALTRYKDSPALPVPEATENKVLHAELKVGESTVLVSDGQGDTPNFRGFSLSLVSSSDDEAERLFIALADGGSVQTPLAPTPFASRFGMLRDRYGVHWIVSSNSKASGDR